MSARLAIDNLRFARDNETLSGTLAMADLDRLSEVRGESSEPVRYELSGQVIAGRPTLCIKLDAVVGLVCQRCLESFDQLVSVENCLPVARNEAEMKRWETEEPMLDVLLADAQFDVRALVEDEILLGLPLAPRHPDGECGVLADRVGSDELV